LSKTYNTGDNEEGVPKKKRKVNVEEKEEREERPKMNRLSSEGKIDRIDEFAYW
jgi:hypothetical protein